LLVSSNSCQRPWSCLLLVLLWIVFVLFKFCSFCFSLLLIWVWNWSERKCNASDSSDDCHDYEKCCFRRITKQEGTNNRSNEEGSCENGAKHTKIHTCLVWSWAGKHTNKCPLCNLELKKRIFSKISKTFLMQR